MKASGNRERPKLGLFGFLGCGFWHAALWQLHTSCSIGYAIIRWKGIVIQQAQSTNYYHCLDVLGIFEHPVLCFLSTNSITCPRLWGHMSQKC